MARIIECPGLSEEILRVQSRRATRARRAQTAQHLVAALVLVGGAFGHLEHNRVLAICAMAAAAVLVGAVIVEKKRRHHHHAGIAWVELAGAAVMLVEAIDRTRGRHHTSFVILSFLGPALLFAFAAFDVQVAARRYIKVDDEGVETRMGLFFRRRVTWDEIRGRGIAAIRLRDVLDRDEASAWLTAQLEKRAISADPSAAAGSPSQ